MSEQTLAPLNGHVKEAEAPAQKPRLSTKELIEQLKNEQLILEGRIRMLMDLERTGGPDWVPNEQPSATDAQPPGAG